MENSNAIPINTPNRTYVHSIQCGLSLAFYNKENRTSGKRAFSHSFTPTTTSLDALVKHITSGYAWTQGYFQGSKRRKDAFISAQTLALDLDEQVSVDDALTEPIIRDYALLVHPSPSSTPEKPKTRVVFVLDTCITNADQWEKLQRGLIHLCTHLRPDPACKDCARMFYGSSKEGAYMNLNAILPLSLLQSLLNDLAEAQVLPSPTERAAALKSHSERPDGGGVRKLSKRLVHDVELGLGVVNGAVNSSGFVAKACACPMRPHEHDHENPAAYWNPGIRALTCFKCGVTYNTHEVAAALGLDVGSYYGKESVWERIKAITPEIETEAAYNLYPFTADITVTLRYISTMNIEALLKTRAVLVKSPIGTGKTEAATKLIEHLGKVLGRSPNVLALTHRQALADDLARRLSQNAEKHFFECYKGLEAIDLRRISRLVICYDSVWKLAMVGERLPQYDLIIIDEIEQFHQHLGGETMRGSEPERAYRVLRQLVKEAPHFLGMDAHATDVSRDWLSGVLGGEQHVTCIYNQYRGSRGQLTLHDNKETAINTALRLAEENKGVVVIPTNTRGMAKRLHHIFSEALGEAHVCVIHGGNSNDQEIQDFIRNINTAINTYKILIYSPSLGTGVDITADVRAVVGIFSYQPLAPADMHQMLGRCRKVRERHVWVHNIETDRETDWQTIYRQHEQSAMHTGLLCEFDEYGILAVNDIQRAMLKLLSLLEARRNHTMNTPLYTFALLARLEGYHLGFCKGENKQMKEKLKSANEQIKQQEKEAVLNASPVDHEAYEQHCMNNTQTAEVQAGYERFKIEDSIGQPITAKIYNDLGTSKKREKLRRFADLTEDPALLQKYDQQEALDQTLLMKRKHRTLCQKLILEVLVSVWGGDPQDPYAILETATHEPVHAEEIAEHITPLINEENSKLLAFIGWRNDQSHKPIAILRWLLDQIGVTLISRQVMVERERFRVYTIKKESYENMLAYAHSRRAHLENKRQLLSEALLKA